MAPAIAMVLGVVVEDASDEDGLIAERSDESI
jgi:hypothetical protein